MRDNKAAMRFEAVDDKVNDEDVEGFIQYIVRDGEYWLIHTEVDERHKGEGVSGVLVQGALDQLRSRSVLVVPTCPVVDAWIGRHPDYRDMVDRPTLRDYKRRHANEA